MPGVARGEIWVWLSYESWFVSGSLWSEGCWFEYLRPAGDFWWRNWPYLCSPLSPQLRGPINLINIFVSYLLRNGEALSTSRLAPAYWKRVKWKVFKSWNVCFFFPLFFNFIIGIQFFTVTVTVSLLIGELDILTNDFINNKHLSACLYHFKLKNALKSFFDSLVF